MRFMELSYPVEENGPKWPSNPEEKVVYEQEIQKGAPCNASSVFHHMHNGTHVDAPRHFNPLGMTIDQIPAEDFYYTAPLVLELPKGKGEKIRLSDLMNREEEIKNCDILFFYTGYSELRERSSKEFTDDFPCFSIEAAEYLRCNFTGLKAVALDFLSVDNSVTGEVDGFPIHHAFLDTGIGKPYRTLLIYEDVNVKKFRELKCIDEIQWISAFPVRFKGLEASPVSMVACIK